MTEGKKTVYFINVKNQAGERLGLLGPYQSLPEAANAALTDAGDYWSIVPDSSEPAPNPASRPVTAPYATGAAGAGYYLSESFDPSRYYGEDR